MAARSIISKLPGVAVRISIDGAARSSSLRFALLRPLAALAGSRIAVSSVAGKWRCFSSRPTTSSLNDSSPNWSNRPPKETILLEGCDFEHWLVVVEPPDPNWTRDEIIDYYIKTLAQVVGSEEEARMKIYSVSTKHYFAFGALVSEEVSYKIKALPKVRWVLPDSYLDVRNKDYGGEPFINGQAVPYDPKYHEEWVRNNARANERSRRNDRPRNFDRSRNFERRRENMQNFQNRDVPPTPMPNNPPTGTVPPVQMPNNPPPGTVPPAQMPNNPPPGTVPPAQMPTAPPQNAMPSRDMPPLLPPNMANIGPQYAGQNSYQNQMPPHGSYPPSNRPFQGGQGYQGGSAGIPSYQGRTAGGPNYQGGTVGHQGGAAGGPAYQGGAAGGPGHQGGAAGGPGHQGGAAGWPGHQGGTAGGPGYQGGPPLGYQQGPSFQGNNPPYQGGGNMGYQGDRPNPGAYQGAGQNYPSNSMNYQGGGGGGNSDQGGGSFQGSVPNFQGRDMGGRDPQ